MQEGRLLIILIDMTNQLMKVFNYNNNLYLKQYNINNHNNNNDNNNRTIRS